jgi:hypothetical protein
LPLSSPQIIKDEEDNILRSPLAAATVRNPSRKDSLSSFGKKTTTSYRSLALIKSTINQRKEGNAVQSTFVFESKQSSMKLHSLQFLPFAAMIFSKVILAVEYQMQPLRGQKKEQTDDFLLFNHDRKLNTIDAGEEGTLCLVADINPSGDSSPDYFIEFNNKLYF